MKDRYSGQPRGFGFITYADPSVVDKVMEDSHVINGKQVLWWSPNSSLFITCYLIIVHVLTIRQFVVDLCDIIPVFFVFRLRLSVLYPKVLLNQRISRRRRYLLVASLLVSRKVCCFIDFNLDLFLNTI